MKVIYSVLICLSPFSLVYGQTPPPLAVGEICENGGVEYGNTNTFTMRNDIVYGDRDCDFENSVTVYIPSGVNDFSDPVT